MTFTSLNSWNNTILCVDDDAGILSYYRQVLAPPVTDAAGLARARLAARRQSWYADEEPGMGSGAGRHFRLLTAASGDQALDIVREERRQGRHIAAGFFDLRMAGGMDSLEAIRRIKALDTGMMCAVVTTYTDQAGSRVAGVFQRPDEWIYFNKPFVERELIQAAHHLVSGWNVRRERDLAIAQVRLSQERLQPYTRAA